MGHKINACLLCLFFLCTALPLMAEETEMPHWEKNDAGKYGLISAAGDTLTRFKYDTVYAFYNGVAPVKKDELGGYVNIRGKEIAKPTYSFVLDEFGNVSIHPAPHGQPRMLGWVYHPTLGGSSWIDSNGKTLATGTKNFFTLRDKVPEGLWDY